MDAQKFNYILANYKRDKQCFIELYEYYYHRIVFHVGWKFGKEVAEDVAQDFFVKLMRIELDHPVEYPTTWVYTVADNIAKSFIKKFKTYDELTGDEFYEFSTDVSEREMLKTASNELDLLDKTIITMYYWEGYSLKEIASITNNSYEMIKKRHARALKKMGKVLKKLK